MRSVTDNTSPTFINRDFMGMLVAPLDDKATAFAMAVEIRTLDSRKCFANLLHNFHPDALHERWFWD